MIKLLKANYARMIKSKLFYLCAAASFLIPAVNILVSGAEITEKWQDELTLEAEHFGFLPLLAAVFAVFASIFFGVEYSDGTIRNKIVCGCTKTQVYLSNFIAVTTADLMFLTCFILSGLVGFSAFGGWSLETKELFLYFCVMVFITLAWSAVLTFIFMLCPNTAVCAVVSLMTVFALTVAASGLYDKLSEPETQPSHYEYSTDDGTPEMIFIKGGEPNPYYVGGAARTVLNTLFRLLPSGVSILAANVELETDTVPYVLLCLTVTAAVICGTGLILFKRKNLN